MRVRTASCHAVIEAPGPVLEMRKWQGKVLRPSKHQCFPPFVLLGLHPYSYTLPCACLGLHGSSWCLENSAFVPKTRKAQRLGRLSGSREENASHGFQAPTATGNKIISVTTDFPARNISPCLFYKERNKAGHFSVIGLRNFGAQNEVTEPLGWLREAVHFPTALKEPSF